MLKSDTDKGLATVPIKLKMRKPKRTTKGRYENAFTCASAW
jgi:hypothetical protein